jgi:hypothetical protein
LKSDDADPCVPCCASATGATVEVDTKTDATATTTRAAVISMDFIAADNHSKEYKSSPFFDISRFFLQYLGIF